MRRTSAAASTLAALVLLLAHCALSVQAIWLREYSDAACTVPTTNIGGLPNAFTAGQTAGCVPYVQSRAFTGSQRVTCKSNQVVVERFRNDGACQGTPSESATYSGSPSSSICIAPTIGFRYYRISCTEPDAEQSALVATTTYADAACNTPQYGPVYSDNALGSCVAGQNGARKQASYCSADRSQFLTYSYDDPAACSANRWTEVQRVETGRCVGTYDGETLPVATVYTKSVCPTSPGPAPPTSWPPSSDSAVQYGCADATCTQDCRAKRAFRLGYCRDESSLGAPKSLSVYCTSDSLNFGSVTYADSGVCSAKISAYVQFADGPSTCDRFGSYASCPPSVSTAGTMPALPPVVNVQYSDSMCTREKYFAAYFYDVAPTCFGGSVTFQASSSSITRSQWNQAACSGTATTQTYTSDQCVPVSNLLYSSNLWTSTSSTNPSRFTLPIRPRVSSSTGAARPSSTGAARISSTGAPARSSSTGVARSSTGVHAISSTGVARSSTAAAQSCSGAHAATSSSASAHASSTAEGTLLEVSSSSTADFNLSSTLSSSSSGSDDLLQRDSSSSTGGGSGDKNGGNDLDGASSTRTPAAFLLAALMAASGLIAVLGR